MRSWYSEWTVPNRAYSDASTSIPSRSPTIPATSPTPTRERSPARSLCETRPIANRRSCPTSTASCPKVRHGGRSRRSSASSPTIYLLLLLRCGLETIGDVAITNGEAPNPRGSYRRLSGFDLRALFSAMEELAESTFEARLSLAGTQGKAGLAHMPGAPMDEGWLQPLDGAASTHILKTGSLPDIPLLEYLCMKAAAACGIAVAPVHLLDFGRPVLCVERYDRRQLRDRGEPVVSRLHQEDLLQAFGVPPEAKYRELEPSTAAAVGSFIRMRSSRPIEDLEAFARITCFNYLVGNCDNHLKNLSILYTSTWKSFRLALRVRPRFDNSIRTVLAIDGDEDRIGIGHRRRLA